MSVYDVDEAYDESDWETAFEDLGSDEARRRRRRRGGRQPRVRLSTPGSASRAATTPAAVRREIEAGRRRDQQIARAVNETDSDLNTLEGRLTKANRDLGRLRTLALVSLLLPRPLGTQRLTIGQAGSPAEPRLEFTTDTNRPGVDVVTGAGAGGPDITSLLLFLTLGRDIGSTGRPGANSTNDMLPILLLVLLPSLTGQAGGQPGQANQSSLLLVLLLSGALS
jgi:hypothetical protein